jgi:hypothetical protein
VVAAILLGALRGFATDQALAPWIAVLTTAGAALLAHLGHTRYEYLAAGYQATADRLDNLLARWRSQPPGASDRGRFILDCENALATENDAWLAEWSREGTSSAAPTTFAAANPAPSPRAI